MRYVPDEVVDDTLLRCFHTLLNFSELLRLIYQRFSNVGAAEFQPGRYTSVRTSDIEGIRRE